MAKKRIRWFDWAILIILAVASHLVFQQGDIIHTGGASFGYLDGHIRDFYSYTDQTVGGCAYMPTTYILFAIWNIPLKLLGLKTVSSMDHTYIVKLWYTGLPILCYVGIAVIMFKLALEMGFGEKKSRVAAYAFAASPIAFFSQFIFGQYDSITLFFVMLGTLFFFRDRTFGFVASFAVAVTCKYYALLIFLPMLLLKEKKVWRIIAQGAGFMSLFILEFVFYLQDRSMAGHITGFNATTYIFNVVLDTGEVFPKISLVMLLWVSICAWAFFTNPKDRVEQWKWFLYFEGFVMFCVFGLSMWHPQWVMLAIPFMVFGTMMHERNDIFWLLDLILMLCYTWFTVGAWPNHLDHCLMRGGLLNDMIGNRYFSAVTIRDFPPYSIGHMTMPFSCISALFLVNALFKHPKFMIASPETDTNPQVGLLRLRFLGGIAMFIVPCMICFYTMMKAPYAYENRIMDAYDPAWVTTLQEGQESYIAEQYFSPKTDTLERIDIKFDCENGVGQGHVHLALTDVTDGKLLYETDIARNTIKTTKATHVTFTPIALHREHVYKVSLSCNPADGGYLGLYYMPDAKAGSEMTMNGEPQDKVAAIEFFGR